MKDSELMPRKTVYNKITTQEKLDAINVKNIELTGDFLEYLCSIDRSPQTIKQYAADLNIFWCWNQEFNKNKFFVDLTKREISKFQNHALNIYGWSPKRIRRVKSTLSSLSNFIETILDEEDDYQDFKAIVNKISSPQNETVREKTVLSNEKVELLLDTLVEKEEYEKAAAVAICAFSGMRKSELLQMKMCFFDADHMHGDFLYETDKIRSKGAGKAGKQINKFIMKKVDKYIDLWRKEREKLNIDSEWVFVVNKNGKYERRITVDGWTNYFSIIIDEDFYFHSLRHFTCTTLVADYNLPASIVKEFFKWNNESMISIYNDRSAVDDFGKYFTADGIVKVQNSNFSDIK